VREQQVVQKIELRVSNHAPHTRYACGLLGLFDAAAGFLLVQLARYDSRGFRRRRGHHQATSWTQLTRLGLINNCFG
jgi:hypothetical protein